jgi:DNA-binding CsgD family transcriptional regulator
VCGTLHAAGVQQRALPEFMRLTNGDSGGIHLLDHRHRATVASIVGAPPTLLYEFEELDRSDCRFLKRSMATRFPVHDAMVYATAKDHLRGPQGRLLESYGLEHCMLVPLIRNGRAVGTVTISRKIGRPPFSAAEQRLADQLARFVSIALTNASVHEALVGEEEPEPSSTDATARDGAVSTVRLSDTGSVAIHAARGATASSLRGTLSHREVEVFELLATGLTNVEMASELGIAVNTIKQHLKQIYRKLGARSRLEAVHNGYAAGHAD